MANYLCEIFIALYSEIYTVHNRLTGSFCLLFLFVLFVTFIESGPRWVDVTLLTSKSRGKQHTIGSYKRNVCVSKMSRIILTNVLSSQLSCVLTSRRLIIYSRSKFCKEMCMGFY